jgi:hypothetical protein
MDPNVGFSQRTNQTNGDSRRRFLRAVEGYVMTIHERNEYVRELIIIKTVYLKVSGLAAWNENCKWYSSLPLGAVVWLFCNSF